MTATETARGAPDPSVLTPEEASLQRKLKMLVIGLGALIVLGLLAVIGRVVYLAANKASGGGAAVASAGSTAASILPEGRLDLPAGAVIRNMSVSGERLAVHFDAPGGAGIAIVDTASGRLISRLRIAPEPPRN